MNEIVKDEIIEFLQKEIEKLEKENLLLQKTIIRQKEVNQKLFKKINDLRFEKKKEQINKFDLGFNPYQE
jgi:septal ring factor EnvC (AmiA/AmiB activator)